MILLDTSVLIDLLANKKEAIEVISRYQNQPLGISVVTLAEIELGFLFFVSKKQKAAQEKFHELMENGTLKVFEVEEKVALEYARLQTSLLKKGKSLSGFDGLIVATALVNNTSFLTSDQSLKEIKDERLTIIFSS
jgi:predicted nucleic acid-binding protein